MTEPLLLPDRAATPRNLDEAREIIRSLWSEIDRLGQGNQVAPQAADAEQVRQRIGALRQMADVPLLPPPPPG